MDKTERLRQLLRKRTQSEAEIPIQHVVRFYLDHFTVFTYTKAGKLIMPGLEKITEEPDEEITKTPDLSKEDDSNRKILARIRSLLNCNKFELYVTWTVKEDRYNYERIKAALSSWLNTQQKRYGKFEYCIVAELHKDKAIHFHGLLKGYKGNLRPAYDPHTNKRLTYKGRKAFNLSGYRSGFSLAFEINDTAKDRRQVSGYLTKYLTKDLFSQKFKKRYWPSRGLNRPHVEYDIDLSMLTEEPFFSTDNEFGLKEFYKYPPGMKRFEYD